MPVTFAYKKAAGAPGLAVLLALALFCAALSCHAQMTLDGSRGVAGTFTGNNFAIRSAYGTRAEGNLFHSFGQFNVLAGQSATFYNPSSVTNIIGRVTGPGYSIINGTIAARLEVGGMPTATLSSANLWLLNPRGVIFGPGASLDLGGSFHVSTADYLKLGSGPAAGIYRSSLSPTSTLSSAAPSAFGFVSASLTGIGAAGATLAVQPGKTLSLVGGEVLIVNDSLGNPSKLKAPGGRINIASAAGAGEIAIGDAVFGAGAGQALGKVTLENSELLVQGPLGTDSGSIHVRAGRLELRSGGNIDVGVYGIAGAAGVADLRASESVLIDGTNAEGIRSGVYASSFSADPADRGGTIGIAAPAVTVSNNGTIVSRAQGAGAGGTIKLEADRLELRSGGQIDAGSRSAGSGGSVNVAANEWILVDAAGAAQLTGIFARAEGAGKGGTLTLRTPRLAVSNGGLIAAFATASGDAGALDVEVGTLELFTAGRLDAGARSTSSGRGGTVTVDAGTIEVSGGASIDAGTVNSTSTGAGGTVTVRATGPIVIDGLAGIPFSTGILANTAGSGRAGDVSVQTPALTVMNGGAVSSSTAAAGDAGNVTVTVDTLSLLSGSWIMSGRLSGNAAGPGTGSGSGGRVEVTAKQSILIDGDHPSPPLSLINSSVFAGTGGAGPGGELVVSAPSITLSNRGAIQSFTTGSGAAGSVTVNAGRLELSDGGSIDTGGGAGAGGTITVNADSVTIRGVGATGLPSSISADTAGSARAGDISITTPLLTVAERGTIRSTTIGTGAAGSITIAAGALEMRDRALITVQSADDRPPDGPVLLGGPAGSITIDAGRRLTMSGGSRINARTESAPAGDIRIRASELVFLSGSEISTSVAGGSGNGGNIFIDPVFVTLQDSRIIANASRGNGGNIQIVSDFFFSSASTLEASSELGISGTVKIDSPNQNANPAQAVLSSAYLDASGLLRASCAARAGSGGVSSFTGAGRGGMAAAPEGFDAGPGAALTSRLLPGYAAQGLKLAAAGLAPGRCGL